MQGLIVPTKEPVSWSEAATIALEYGPKGSRLLTLPRQWTPPFVLLSVKLVSAAVQGAMSTAQKDELNVVFTALWGEHGVIVRSSILGETIWERGSFESIKLAGRQPEWSAFVEALQAVQSSAPGRDAAVVVQTYAPPDEWGELGNLNRVSKTRDHWQYSIFGADPVAQNQRFNSQRDAEPDPTARLLARRGLPKERLFGSIGAWINNSLLRGHQLRVNCEWLRHGDTFYIVQVDGEDEDIYGLNPLQSYVPPSLPSEEVAGEFLRRATVDDRSKWDKLAVLDQLYEPTDLIIPVLYVLNVEDAVPKNAAMLTADFERLVGLEIVVRVSGMLGAEKITNLPKTDCCDPRGAAEWCIEQATKLLDLYPGTTFAFVAHRFIASRASAWVRVDPESPMVEVHGTWGLPDGLQFCPYDIWDVHVPSEQVNEYPEYKSNILVASSGGNWTFQRVKNEIARFQSLTRHQVLDVALRSSRIASRLGKPCHIMWFVGCRTDAGVETNLPWYWVEAHKVDIPDKRSTVLYRVEAWPDLEAIPRLAAKYPGLGIILSAKSPELLRSKKFLEGVSEVTVPLQLPIFLEGSALAHAFFQLQKNGCVVIPAGERDHVRARRQINYAKLVRDKIPERIEAQQEKQSVAIIPDEYRAGFLIGKLFEEGLEVREAPSQSEERLFELADIYEVIRALALLSGRQMDDVALAADAKRSKAGGFEGAHLLLETSLPLPGQAAPNRSDTISDQAALLVEHLEDDVVRLPFTFMGFSPLDSRRSVRLPSLGLIVHVVLKRDCLEISFSKDAAQLELPL